VKDHQVRHQVIVPDNLALLFAIVLPNDPVTSKGSPLDKSVPGFDGIRRRIDGPSHLLITDKVE
jgi:hypothetical protein